MLENYGWKAVGNLNVTKLSPKVRKEVGEYRRMILASCPSFIGIQKLDLKALIDVHRSIEVCAMKRCYYQMKQKQA